MKQHLLYAVAAALLAASGALAAPPMGMTVPLPEALPPRTFELQVDVQGVQVLQAAEADQRLGLQFGLPEGFEVGVDVRLGPPRDDWHNDSYRNWDLQYRTDLEGTENLWLNVKRQVLTETTSRPALAAGLLSLAARGPSGRYLVAGKHFGDFQVTLGWADVYNQDFYTQALYYRPHNDWTWMFEHITAGRFSTNLGFKHPLGDHLTLTAGWLRANNRFYHSELVADLTYTGQW